MRLLPYRVTKWKVSLPTRTAARVEMRLSNISGTGPQYGARSKLINALLEEWLDLPEGDQQSQIENLMQEPADA